MKPYYVLAPAGLEGPYETVDEARTFARLRGLSVAETLPYEPPKDGETVVVPIGLVADDRSSDG